VEYLCAIVDSNLVAAKFLSGVDSFISGGDQFLTHRRAHNGIRGDTAADGNGKNKSFYWWIIEKGEFVLNGLGSIRKWLII
jgi:hypothetical protein